MRATRGLSLADLGGSTSAAIVSSMNQVGSANPAPPARLARSRSRRDWNRLRRLMVGVILVLRRNARLVSHVLAILYPQRAAFRYIRMRDALEQARNGWRGHSFGGSTCVG